MRVTVKAFTQPQAQPAAVTLTVKWYNVRGLEYPTADRGPLHPKASVRTDSISKRRWAVPPALAAAVPRTRASHRRAARSLTHSRTVLIQSLTVTLLPNEALDLEADRVIGHR